MSNTDKQSSKPQTGPEPPDQQREQLAEAIGGLLASYWRRQMPDGPCGPIGDDENSEATKDEAATRRTRPPRRGRSRHRAAGAAVGPRQP